MSTQSINNDLLNLIFNRKSIRRFCTASDGQPKSVSEQIVRKIVEAGQRAPSACNMQPYSIIWIVDNNLRKEVWKTCGQPNIIKQASALFLLCADTRRLQSIFAAACKQNNYSNPSITLQLFGIIDACLVAENMTLACEAIGLGSVMIGNALANRRLMEVFKIPKGVFPVMLLCVGYPAENPPLRPRLPMDTVLHVNEYKDVESDFLLKECKRIGDVLKQEKYYEKYANKTYSYLEHFVRKMKSMKAEKSLIKALQKTGFFQIRV